MIFSSSFMVLPSLHLLLISDLWMASSAACASFGGEFSNVIDWEPLLLEILTFKESGGHITISLIKSGDTDKLDGSDETRNLSHLCAPSLQFA